MSLFRKRQLTTTQIIGVGFLMAIFIGTILLSLPIATKDGKATPFIDAMFSATTATCVTGLTTVNTMEHWNAFGKIVILCLIQFGGLGIVTFTTTILLAFQRRITLKERLLIQSAYNLDTLQGLVKLTINILKITLIIEGIGAFLFCFQYIPEYGWWYGIGKSVFQSVSAFCNAGMDIVGSDSLAPYCTNVLINFTTMILIVLGGIGFPVLIDLLHVAKCHFKKENQGKKIFFHLTLHSKLVLSITGILIFGSALIILLFEWNNKASFGNLNWWQKPMAALFQSITARTAGFYTVSQSALTNGTVFLTIILMFIGGSPSGTAGGVKTVTVGMMVLAVCSIVKGKTDVEAFGRKITESYVKKGMAVVLISLATVIVVVMALSITEQGDFLKTLFESASAIGTAGLSMDFTGQLSVIGKYIIIVAMYAGRIGPITLALFFNSKSSKNGNKTLPTEKIIVG